MITCINRLSKYYQAKVSADYSKKFTDWPDRHKSAGVNSKVTNGNRNKIDVAVLPNLSSYKVASKDKAASEARLKGIAELAKRKWSNIDSSFHRDVHINQAHEEDDAESHEEDCAEEDKPPQNAKGQEISSHKSFEKERFSRGVLHKAEDLLSRVKKSTAALSSKSSTESTGINSNFPAFCANADNLSLIKSRLFEESMHSKGIAKGKDDLEWLIRGVPEVYGEEDSVIDDDMVEQLLKEGGKPPSQLHFPSLHAASQETLLNLEKAKVLSLTLTEICVYTAKFGVRKEGTYVVIRCPAGCTMESSLLNNNITKIEDNKQVISLDLGDPSHKVNAIGHKNVLKEYFVGTTILDVNVKWNISITDDLLSDWLKNSNSCASSSLIHIDLYCYLLPPTSTKKAKSGSESKRRDWSASALLLGTAEISLQSLLSWPCLQAYVSADIDLDQASHSTISDRLSRLPKVPRASGAVQNQNKLGSLKCKIQLLDSNSRAFATSSEHSRNDHHTHSSPSSAASRMKTLDSALSFIPQEYPSDLTTSNLKEKSDFFKTDEKKFTVGIALHSLSVNKDIAVDITGKRMSKLLVSYKIALAKERYMHCQLIFNINSMIIFYCSFRGDVETIIATNTYKSTNNDQYVSIAAGRVHTFFDVMNWRYIYFEVWAKQRDETPYESNTLVGFARYPVGSDFGKPVVLEVFDPVTGKVKSSLRLTLFIHDSPDNVEKELQKCLTSEHVRELLLRDLDQPMVMETKEPAEPGTVKESLPEDERKLLVPTLSEEVEERSPERADDKVFLSDKNEPQSCKDSLQMSVDSLSGSINVSSALGNAIESVSSSSSDDVLSEDRLESQKYVTLESQEKIVSEQVDAQAHVTNDTEFAVEPVVQAKPTSSGDYASIEETNANTFAAASDESHNSVESQSLHTIPDVVKDSGDDVENNDGIGHVLDISVGGVADALLRHFPTRRNSMGCFVCYAFPGLDDSNVGHWNALRIVKEGLFAGHLSLWWDHDCSILNSRNRHEFTVPGGCSALSALGFCEESSSQASECIKFSIIPSDEDGNMLHDTKPIASFSLPIIALGKIMQRSGFSEILDLPLCLLESKSDIQENVKLSVSHRILPSRVSLSLSSSNRLLSRPESNVTDIDRETTEKVTIQEEASFEENASVGITLKVCIEQVKYTCHNYSDSRKGYIACSSTSKNTDFIGQLPASEHFQTPVLKICDLLSAGSFFYSDKSYDILLKCENCLSDSSSPRIKPHELKTRTLYFSLHILPEWCISDHEKPHPGRDESIGLASVSLCPLSLGYPCIDGWYYLTNSNDERVGQIKLKISPDGEDIDNSSDVCDVVRHDDESVAHSFAEISPNWADFLTELEASRQKILSLNSQSVEEEMRGHDGKNISVVDSLLHSNEEKENIRESPVGDSYSSCGSSCSSIHELKASLNVQNDDEDVFEISSFKCLEQSESLDEYTPLVCQDAILSADEKYLATESPNDSRSSGYTSTMLSSEVSFADDDDLNHSGASLHSIDSSPGKNSHEALIGKEETEIVSYEMLQLEFGICVCLEDFLFNTIDERYPLLHVGNHPTQEASESSQPLPLKNEDVVEVQASESSHSLPLENEDVLVEVQASESSQSLPLENEDVVEVQASESSHSLPLENEDVLVEVQASESSQSLPLENEDVLVEVPVQDVNMCSQSLPERNEDVVQVRPILDIVDNLFLGLDVEVKEYVAEQHQSDCNISTEEQSVMQADIVSAVDVQRENSFSESESSGGNLTRHASSEDSCGSPESRFGVIEKETLTNFESKKMDVEEVRLQFQHDLDGETKSSEEEKNNVKEYLSRNKIKPNTYEQNVRSDILEVSKVIESAMRSSGLKYSSYSENIVFPHKKTSSSSHHSNLMTNRKFIDAETERISKIMLGSMKKYATA